MPTTYNPVLTMLKADHKKVKGLFAEYHQATPRKQQDIAQMIIEELEVHAGLEEELIYSAIRKGTKDDKLMNEANEEHHLVHVLIAELKELESRDEAFKEEGEMFPEAQKAKIDWDALMAEVMERKEQLMAKV